MKKNKELFDKEYDRIKSELIKTVTNLLKILDVSPKKHIEESYIKNVYFTKKQYVDALMSKDKKENDIKVSNWQLTQTGWYFKIDDLYNIIYRDKYIDIEFYLLYIDVGFWDIMVNNEEGDGSEDPLYYNSLLKCTNKLNDIIQSKLKKNSIENTEYDQYWAGDDGSGSGRINHTIKLNINKNDLNS